MKAIVYPLKVINGQVLTTDTYTRIVQQNILASLKTYQEERVMRPLEFMPRNIFDSQESLPRILSEVRQAIADALALNFPEVSYSLQGAVTDDGIVTVVVLWTSPDTDPQELEVTL